MTTPSAAPAGPGVTDPAPDAFVLPFARLRPGSDPAKLLPHFGRRIGLRGTPMRAGR